MREHSAYFLEAHPWQRQQVMHDRHLHFADDRQIALHQQVVVAVNRSADRVLNRDDSQIDGTVGHGVEDFVEGRIRARLRIRQQPEHGGLTECARFSLIRDSHADPSSSLPAVRST